MTEEIYPMPSFATLVVRDLEESSKFYQEALGFKHIFTMPGSGGKPALVHLRWLKYADLLIALSRDSKELDIGWSLPPLSTLTLILTRC